MTVIALNAPKGGTGTTFVAAQLALALAANGRTVTAVDCTLTEGLKLYFGLMPSQSQKTGDSSNESAPVISGVRLVETTEKQGSSRISEIERVIGYGAHDVVILDIASADRELVKALYGHIDLHLCVMDPTAAALASLVHLAGEQPVTRLEKFAVVLNRLDERYKLSRHCRKFLSDLLPERFAGTIRRDEAVNEALASFEPLAKFAPHSVVIPDIEKLVGALEAKLGGKPLPEPEIEVRHDNSIRKTG